MPKSDQHMLFPRALKFPSQPNGELPLNMSNSGNKPMYGPWDFVGITMGLALIDHK